MQGLEPSPLGMAGSKMLGRGAWYNCLRAKQAGRPPPTELHAAKRRLRELHAERDRERGRKVSCTRFWVLHSLETQIEQTTSAARTHPALTCTLPFKLQSLKEA